MMIHVLKNVSATQQPSASSFLIPFERPLHSTERSFETIEAENAHIDIRGKEGGEGVRKAKRVRSTTRLGGKR
jgi:hypothetical protein